MNARERVRLALRCHQPDRIPKTLGFSGHTFPETAPATAEDYFGLDVRYVRFKPLPEQDDFREYLNNLPPEVHVGNPEQLRIYHEWDYHPERSAAVRPEPAQVAQAIVERILPSLTEPSRSAGIREQIVAWHQEGLAVAGAPPHLGGVLYEAAYRLRGFEHFMRDLAEREPLAHYVLEQLSELLLQNVVVLADADVDVLLLDDDVAMPTGLVISPEMWQRFIKPRMARAIAVAREVSPELLVFYHSDGDFAALIPDLVEIGVNVINPVQPDCMDAAAIKAAFGDRLALWGTVGTANRWVYGTPEAIRDEVKMRIETLGPEGLLLAPAYDLDFVPFENVVAFCEAADAFGRL